MLYQMIFTTNNAFVCQKSLNPPRKEKSILMYIIQVGHYDYIFGGIVNIFKYLFRSADLGAKRRGYWVSPVNNEE